MYLGMLIAEARMKWRWEPDAIAGGKVRSGGKRGAEAQRANMGAPDYATCRAVFEEELTANGGRIVSAMDAAASRLGVTRKTIQRARKELH